MRAALLLLCALSVALISVNAVPDVDQQQLESLHWEAGLAHAPGANCSWSCSVKDGPRTPSVHAITDGSDAKEIECWGTFRYWCKGPVNETSANATTFFWAARCEGHFKTAAWKPETSAVGVTASFKRVAMCEGGSKWISGRKASCPYTGKTYLMMRGTWGLGTSWDSMEHAYNSSESVSTLSRPSALAKQWEAEARAFVALDEVSGSDVTKGFFKLQGRTEGLSGEWSATREAHPPPPGPRPPHPPHGDDAELADADEDVDVLRLLEGESDVHSAARYAPSVMSTLIASAFNGPMGPPPPPPPHDGPHDGPHPPPDHPHCHPDMYLTCNGRPAWLHGALPCWGVFEVSSEPPSPHPGPDGPHPGPHPHPHPHNASFDHDRLPTATRRLLALPHTTDAAMVSGQGASNPIASKQQQLVQSALDGGLQGMGMSMGRPLFGGHNVTASLHATCKGLYTGALGRMCFGLNTAHFSVAGEGGSLDKWDICSGRFGIHFDHRPEAHGMATFCKGHRTHGLIVKGGCPAKSA